MSHHDHEHHEHHHPCVPDDRGKLHPLIEHWVRHNEDHAASFREWAERAEAAGEAACAAHLREAALRTDLQNDALREALLALGDEPSPHPSR